jgi:hypothetical protein
MPDEILAAAVERCDGLRDARRAGRDRTDPGQGSPGRPGSVLETIISVVYPLCVLLLDLAR